MVHKFKIPLKYISNILAIKLENLRSNPYYLVIENPSLYLKSIGLNTLSVGILVFIINACYIYSPLHTVKIPNGIHSLVGFVIALLLVFRTNTAYDRWWEGRKKITELSSSVSFYVINLSVTSLTQISKDNLINDLKSFINIFKKYLSDNSKGNVENEFHDKLMRFMNKTLYTLKFANEKEFLTDGEFSTLRSSLKEIVDTISACERIKNTPIPFSYYIHIKITIFVYLITLPFSMFYDLNLWSTPIIMALYFLIAGIEIISSEIENPFSGEPNDLPTELLIGNIEKIIKNY